MADKKLRYSIDAAWQGRSATVQARKDIEAVGNAGEKATKGVGSAESASVNFGTTMRNLIAGGTLVAVGKQLLDISTASINVASDVEEAASKFSYVFGPAAEDLGQTLDAFAEDANRSGFALRSMAADVGALTEPILGSKEAAADMSAEVAKLAIDLASFNNVAEADALQALRAGLIGEAEPMRQFGVLLSAAAVDAEVLASGVVNTKNEITDAMRVQARYNLIMEQTATAQGDAIRTSDSYANQQRNLEAAVTDLQVAFGEKLLPVATALAEGLAEDVVPALQDMITELDNADAFDSMANGIKSVTSAVAPAIQFMTKYKDEIRAVRLATVGLVTGETFFRIFKSAYDEIEEFITFDPQFELQADDLRATNHYVSSLEELAQMGRDAAVSTAQLDEESQMLNSTLTDTVSVIENIADARGFDGGLMGDLGQDRQNLGLFAASLRDIEEASSDVATALVPLVERAGNFFDIVPDGSEPTFNLADAIIAAAGAAGVAVDDIGRLAGVYGDYTDEALNAAVETALIRAKIEELTGQLARGEITVGDFRTELQDFTENTVPALISGFDGTGEAARLASEDVITLEADFKRLDDVDVYIPIEVDIEAARAAIDEMQRRLDALGGQGIDRGPGGYQGPPGLATGGTAVANRPYIVGEKGPELFIPNTTGTVVPNHVMNNEFGGDTYYVNVSSDADARQVANTLIQQNQRNRLLTARGLL